MKDKRNKIIRSFAISAIVAIVFVTVATIFSELYKPFKDSLKDMKIETKIDVLSPILAANIVAKGTPKTYNRIQHR